MSAYYNEHDPFAAAWLRELIAAGLIAPGDVDDRSIEDVTPNDLKGYTQHHFFAGIGVWSLALRQAGWPDDRPIWTGSCPCQPFSVAGKGAGFTDERHLWPAFHHLIRVCRPAIVIGEQVASKDGLAWLDLVQADMESEDYAFGAVDTCAAGFGAPHQRQRLYWVGALDVADADADERARRGVRVQPGRSRQDRVAATGGGRIGSVDNVPSARHIGPLGWTEGQARDEARMRLPGAGRGQDRIEPAGPVNGLWQDADWLFCIDGKWRAVEPGTFPLADAGAFRNRVAELRGSGNALNLAQAQGFIEAIIETLSPAIELTA